MCFGQGTPQLRFDHFAAAQAGRAHADTSGGGADFGVDWTQVNIPASLSHVVRVADIVSKLRTLAAKIAYMCHRTAPDKPETCSVKTLF